MRVVFFLVSGSHLLKGVILLLGLWGTFCNYCALKYPIESLFALKEPLVDKSESGFPTISGCYLHYRDVSHETKALFGSDRKVASQIKSFIEKGLSCDFIFVPQPESTVGKIIASLPFTSDGVQWPSVQKLAEYSYIYIRRPRFMSKDMVGCLWQVKKESPATKIILEIPTYPYEQEMMMLTRYPALLKERGCRKDLSQVIDRIADLSGAKQIFGVTTLPIINGIDLSEVLPKTPVPNFATINIIGVAYFAFWHGFDRLIAGMQEYYQAGGTRDICLHLVGDGDVLPALKKQVNAAGLEKRVIFYGQLDRAGMDGVYNRCSLAVESFGGHRKDVTRSSSLKSREYLAKGLPIVHSTDIDVLEDYPVDFDLKVPQDDSPINIDTLLRFHDCLYDKESQLQLIERIRAYAERYIAMDHAMKNVIDFIKEDGSDA